MFDTATLKPEFAKWAAHECDLSDVYGDECDPEGEDGYVCTGFFKTDDCWTAEHLEGDLTLTGIMIDDGVAPIYRDREQTRRMLGNEAVVRVEEVTTREFYEGRE